MSSADNSNGRPPQTTGSILSRLLDMTSGGNASNGSVDAVNALSPSSVPPPPPPSGAVSLHAALEAYYEEATVALTSPMSPPIGQSATMATTTIIDGIGDDDFNVHPMEMEQLQHPQSNNDINMSADHRQYPPTTATTSDVSIGVALQNEAADRLHQIAVARRGIVGGSSNNGADSRTVSVSSIGFGGGGPQQMSSMSRQTSSFLADESGSASSPTATTAAAAHCAVEGTYALNDGRAGDSLLPTTTINASGTVSITTIGGTRIYAPILPIALEANCSNANMNWSNGAPSSPLNGGVLLSPLSTRVGYPRALPFLYEQGSSLGRALPTHSYKVVAQHHPIKWSGFVGHQQRMDSCCMVGHKRGINNNSNKSSNEAKNKAKKRGFGADDDDAASADPRASFCPVRFLIEKRINMFNMVVNMVCPARVGLWHNGHRGGGGGGGSASSTGGGSGVAAARAATATTTTSTVIGSGGFLRGGGGGVSSAANNGINSAPPQEHHSPLADLTEAARFSLFGIVSDGYRLAATVSNPIVLVSEDGCGTFPTQPCREDMINTVQFYWSGSEPRKSAEKKAEEVAERQRLVSLQRQQRGATSGGGGDSPASVRSSSSAAANGPPPPPPQMAQINEMMAALLGQLNAVSAARGTGTMEEGQYASQVDQIRELFHSLAQMRSQIASAANEREEQNPATVATPTRRGGADDDDNNDNAHDDDDESRFGTPASRRTPTASGANTPPPPPAAGYDNSAIASAISTPYSQGGVAPDRTPLTGNSSKKLARQEHGNATHANANKGESLYLFCASNEGSIYEHYVNEDFWDYDEACRLLKQRAAARHARRVERQLLRNGRVGPSIVPTPTSSHAGVFPPSAANANAGSSGGGGDGWWGGSAPPGAPYASPSTSDDEDEDDMFEEADGEFDDDDGDDYFGEESDDSDADNDLQQYLAAAADRRPLLSSSSSSSFDSNRRRGHRYEDDSDDDDADEESEAAFEQRLVATKAHRPRIPMRCLFSCDTSLNDLIIIRPKQGGGVGTNATMTRHTHTVGSSDTTAANVKTTFFEPAFTMIAVCDAFYFLTFQSSDAVWSAQGKSPSHLVAMRKVTYDMIVFKHRFEYVTEERYLSAQEEERLMDELAKLRRERHAMNTSCINTTAGDGLELLQTREKALTAQLHRLRQDGLVSAAAAEGGSNALAAAGAEAAYAPQQQAQMGTGAVAGQANYADVSRRIQMALQSCTHHRANTVVELCRFGGGGGAVSASSSSSAAALLRCPSANTNSNGGGGFLPPLARPITIRSRDLPEPHDDTYRRLPHRDPTRFPFKRLVIGATPQPFDFKLFFTYGATSRNGLFTVVTTDEDYMVCGFWTRDLAGKGVQTNPHTVAMGGGGGGAPHRNGGSSLETASSSASASFLDPVADRNVSTAAPTDAIAPCFLYQCQHRPRRVVSIGDNVFVIGTEHSVVVLEIICPSPSSCGGDNAAAMYPTVLSSMPFTCDLGPPAPAPAVNNINVNPHPIVARGQQQNSATNNTNNRAAAPATTPFPSTDVAAPQEDYEPAAQRRPRRSAEPERIVGIAADPLEEYVAVVTTRRRVTISSSDWGQLQQRHGGRMSNGSDVTSISSSSSSASLFLRRLVSKFIQERLLTTTTPVAAASSVGEVKDDVNDDDDDNLIRSPVGGRNAHKKDASSRSVAEERQQLLSSLLKFGDVKCPRGHWAVRTTLPSSSAVVVVPRNNDDDAASALLPSDVSAAAAIGDKRQRAPQVRGVEEDVHDDEDVHIRSPPEPSSPTANVDNSEGRRGMRERKFGGGFEAAATAPSASSVPTPFVCCMCHLDIGSSSTAATASSTLSAMSFLYCHRCGCSVCNACAESQL